MTDLSKEYKKKADNFGKPTQTSPVINTFAMEMYLNSFIQGFTEGSTKEQYDEAFAMSKELGPILLDHAGKTSVGAILVASTMLNLAAIQVFNNNLRAKQNLSN